MGRFTRIPESTFSGLQVEAGVLLNDFNPANPAITDAAIICATTGGIKATCKATYEDYFADVDNAPNDVKEGKRLTGWECTLETTSLGTTPELIRMSLGAADIDGTDETKIVPRMELKGTDFANIWFVGDRADGGFVAIKIMNALSEDGFSLQTTKNGKGTIALKLKGHVSIANQTVVPMEFYSADPEKNGTGA